SILQEQVAQGLLYRHPPLTSRGAPRYGINPPNPRDYLRTELGDLFARLGQRLGFSQTQLRTAALELLHEEECDNPPADSPAKPEPTTASAETTAPHTQIQPPHRPPHATITAEDTFANINPS